MALWAFAALALLVAVASWMRAGRLARQLASLTQSYWELRYDFTRLRSQVARLDPESEPPGPAPAATSSGQTMGFVSLSSLKKKTDG